MALVVFDRVKETSTTAGTGTIVLAGAVSGYQSFAVVGNANTTYYTIADQTGANWEVGIGTYYSGNVSLARNTILASSNSNSAVTFGSNTKDVFITYPAEYAVYLNNGIVYAGASANVAFSNITASNSVITTAAFTNATVTTAPTQNTDVANKQYVDTIATSGIDYHDPVRLESPNTVGNLTVTYNQPNGAGNGVGATLTNAGANVVLTVDGVLANVSDRILIYNQSNAVQNGVYVVSNTGSSTYQWIMTRSTDADTYGANSAQDLSGGSVFFVTNGNTGAGESYVCNNNGVITFGTTPITFAQISSSQVYSAGTGLSLNNTTFSVSNTAVTASTYGGAANVGTFTVNPQGQLTAASNVAIQIANTQVSGLGTMSTQNANAVAITGGTINNVAFSNVTYSGLGTMSTQNANSIAVSGGIINNVQIGPTTANTGAFTNLSASGPFFATSTITTTSYTGYLYGNNSAAITASTTIPSTAITGLGTMSTQNANAVAITGGTINNVAFSNVTYSGLGTMSTQNANNVTITGGSLNNVTIGLTTPLAGIFTNVTATGVHIGNGAALSNLNASNVSSGVLSPAYGGTGLTSPGTSGNILTSNGTAWTSSTPAASGALAAGNSSIVINNVNITANATIAAGQNGFSVGPVNTANGITVTVTSGQSWVVI
jgi:hypothetical protein